MSSRALRKLQKQREQNEQLTSQDVEEAGSDAGDSIQEPRRPAPKFNAFDLLNAADEEQDSDQGESGEEAPQMPDALPAPSKPTETKRKKKKKKGKKSSVATKPDDKTSDDAELDDIDRALKELSATRTTKADDTHHPPQEDARDNELKKARERLLAVDSRNLNAMNEMKKLFGNVVLETRHEDQPNNGTGRRRDRNRQALDLGRALTGRYNPASGGQDLSGIATRKNVLMQGKDEWPRATSGGLGMEVVEKLQSGVTSFKIVHNTAYNDVQRQFETCVESMDPQRLIELLQFNPYNLSTLLQVSEIAKQQGDHSVSADLLERALFNIGRSAHSSFGACLKEGKARLDFKLKENRELWLAGWRYIINLGMKGTWRTAYEWAKLLLSLDSRDPYAISLIIDQLALRGREFGQFIELCTQTGFGDEWETFSNIQCSLALAYYRQDKPKESRQQLRVAMAQYPWIFCRLAQELNIEPMPKRIWGKLPPDQPQELLCELYVARAKDIWNTPETVSLLVEVADTTSLEEQQVGEVEISLDVARHVLLSDIPAVTTHLPARFTSGRISASDPLPPPDSESQHPPVLNQPPVLQLPENERPQWLRNLINEVNPGNPGDALLQIARGAVRLPQAAIEGLIQELREHPPGGALHDGDVQMGVFDDDVPGQAFPTDDDWAPGLPAEGTAERQAFDESRNIGFLTVRGLRDLHEFLRVNGVDRGNWSDDLDIQILTEYVRRLREIQPSQRSLYWEQVRERTTPQVLDLVEDELERQEAEETE